MSEVRIPAGIESVATAAVDAAFAVHRALGPGLLESAYHECLAIELNARGHQLVREHSIPLIYRGQIVANAYRADMIVDGKLLLELKAIDSLQPIHRVQVTTYLRILRLPLGLLINFNVPLIKDGIHRVLNLDFRDDQTGSTVSALPPVASSRLRA